jgi:hypothetical protein
MKNKILILTVFFCLFSFTLKAQNHEDPGSTPPPAEWLNWFNSEVEKFKEKLSAQKTQFNNYTIPVIVHIVHTGQPVGVFPNIDSNRVKAQIKVLNEDFAGTPYNPNNITHYTNLMVNTGIQFCLAQFDPQGNPLPERGINRINSIQKFGVSTSTMGATNFFPWLDTALKPKTIWDPTKYLNIWVTDHYCNCPLATKCTATYPPGTTMQGLFGVGTPSTDGIWIVNKIFGSNVAGYAPGPNYDPNVTGRNLTREVAKWLGVLPIMGYGNCGTDYCNDTPPQANKTSSCPASYPHNVNSCGPNTSPQGEMTMNFMDYTPDPCRILFTNDQRVRMHTALSQSPLRSSLGQHGLCSTPPVVVYPPGPPVAHFEFKSPYPCSNQQMVPINNSTVSPAGTYSWVCNPPNMIFMPNNTMPAPTMSLSAPGNYTLTLIVTNSLGTSSYSMAFNATVCPPLPKCLDTLKAIKPADTLRSYAAPLSTVVLGCGQQGKTGFLTGTNCYKDKEFAQYFRANQYSLTPQPVLNRVFVLFNANGTKQNNIHTFIKCNVWGGDLTAGPVSLIGQKADSLATIIRSINPTPLAPGSPTNQTPIAGNPNIIYTSTNIIQYMFGFSPPITLPTNGFFVGVETPWGSTDSIQIFSNSHAAGGNDSTAYVRTSTNTWFPIKKKYKSNIQLAIVPVIGCKPTTAPVGLNEQDNNHAQFILFPNPSNGVFNLLIQSDKLNTFNIQVTDMMGKILSAKEVKNISNEVLEIDLSGHEKGVYFIVVQNDKQKTVLKAIHQ